MEFNSFNLFTTKEPLTPSFVSNEKTEDNSLPKVIKICVDENVIAAYCSSINKGYCLPQYRSSSFLQIMGLNILEHPMPYEAAMLDLNEILEFEALQQKYKELRKKILNSISTTSNDNIDFILDILFDELELSTRLRNCLRAEGYETVRNIQYISGKDLKKCPNLGAETLKELKVALVKIGAGPYVQLLKEKS